MIYHQFGRTKLDMPVLTCGGMRFQHSWQDMPMSEIPTDAQANLEATVRRALEAGINHIETARGYGTSERQLGQILPALPRKKLILQTKVGPSDDPDEFTANVKDSLNRLRLESVDLLAIHGINDEQSLERSVKPHGCLAAARKLQTQGRTRHVGFSSHGPTDVIREAIATERDGGFDYVNLHWFYIQQIHWPAIEDATRREMGVFIISPTEKGGKLFDPPAKLVKLCEPLHPIVFNDLFCLRPPQVHTISIGAARPGDFDLHLEAVEHLDRADRLVPPIVERLDRTMVEAVGGELADPFNLGLPTWQKTPGEINIPLILWLRNLAVAYDMVEYGKMRYNLLGNGGTWFPGQNAAKVDAIDLGPVLGDCPVADRVPALLNEAHELLSAEPRKRLMQND